VIRNLPEIVSEAKLLAMMILFGAAIAVGVTASYLGHPEWGSDVVISIFPIVLIWAIKRDMGAFGVFLNSD